MTKTTFSNFIARAFMIGCGFRLAIAIVFALFCVFFGNAEYDSLHSSVKFIGNTLMVLLLFDVSFAWPNKSLSDLPADPQLEYLPQPYIYVTFPLCIVTGTLLLGALLLTGKHLLAKWKTLNKNPEATND